MIKEILKMFQRKAPKSRNVSNSDRLMNIKEKPIFRNLKDKIVILKEIYYVLDNLFGINISSGHGIPYFI